MGLRKTNFKETLLIFLQVYSVSYYCCNAYMVGNNPHRRVEILDSQGKYRLEWLVDFNTNKVTFNVTVQTKGYVGFGLSRRGKMSGADIVIGGVQPNGKVYFTDRHAVGNQLPEIDPNQDWTLNKAWESQNHTFLSFSRLFDTCDPQDYLITKNKISLIWAYGEKDDEVQYHFQNRGMFEVYLLDPDYSPQIIREPRTGLPKVLNHKDSAELKLWAIPRRLQIPSDETTYFCSMYKAPRLHRKHHVIGFDVYFATEESRTHTHHILVYKCNAPRGGNGRRMFDPFIGDNNMQTCYTSQTGPMPTDYCTETFIGWAVGGRAYFHPDHLGFPIGNSQDEYYMVQVHYNNPSRRADIVVDLRVEFHYTSNLRPHDAGIILIAHNNIGPPPSVLIPPSSISHNIYGHCSSQCTRRMLPPDGITLSATFLHSHNSGRQARLQHFRNNRELPWVQADDNYNNLYQNFRTHIKEVKALPGDHFTIRCTYDSTWTNGTVVGGFSTRQEMCSAFVIYYNKMTDYSTCYSETRSDEFRKRFLGVTNVTWDEPSLEYIVNSPQKLAGLSISQVSDNYVDWNIGKRTELEKFHELHPQSNICDIELYARDSSTEEGNTYAVPTGYPFSAAEYRPPQRKCATTS